MSVILEPTCKLESTLKPQKFKCWPWLHRSQTNVDEGLQGSDCRRLPPSAPETAPRHSEASVRSRRQHWRQPIAQYAPQLPIVAKHSLLSLTGKRFVRYSYGTVFENKTRRGGVAW